MSFWKYMFDSEYQQRADIEALKNKSRRQLAISRKRQRRSAEKVDDLKGRIDELEEEIGSLELLNRALLKYLRQSDAWDEQAFCTVLHELDMEDGKLDGK
jgi:hypothetical protein